MTKYLTENTAELTVVLSYTIKLYTDRHTCKERESEQDNEQYGHKL